MDIEDGRGNTETIRDRDCETQGDTPMTCPYKIKPATFNGRVRFLLSYLGQDGRWHTYPGVFTDREQATRTAKDLTRG